MSSSLQGVIARWGTAYTFKRTTGAALVNGVYTPGSETTLPMVASIQAVTGDDLKSLPEGQHHENTRVVFTETELKVREEGAFEADKVIFEGADWTVFKAEYFFAETWGDHYRALISKIVVV